MRALVVSVLPFDRVGFKNPHNVPKYAEKGLKTLEACADTLLSELRIESVATGLNVRVEVGLVSVATCKVFIAVIPNRLQLTSFKRCFAELMCLPSALHSEVLWQLSCHESPPAVCAWLAMLYCNTACGCACRGA